MELCDHCGLSVGRFGHSAEASGEDKSFCCYGCFVAWQAANGGGDDSVAAAFLIRLGVGAFLTMNIMLFSLLLYSGTLDEIGPHAQSWVHWLLLVLATPALIILGSPFLRETIAGFRRHQLAPATLITMGAGAAYVYSAIATLQNTGRVYFDTAAMVLLLFTLGRYLEANARARAARSLRPMLKAEQQKVTCVVDAQNTTLALKEVNPGMIVRVLPGERIPVDGKVTKGESQADESTLSGEPHPLSKKPGSYVLAGSINGDQVLLIETTVAGLESQWLTICKDVRTALSTPTRSQQIAEKAMVVFVPTVIVLAILAIWLNWEPSNAANAMLAGLSVLVVACPCALGLASPLATSLAISRLLDNGILVRNAAALETLSSLRTLCMDKTGTLTSGHITCEDTISSDPDILGNDVVKLAATVAHGSKHPLSLSVVHTADSRNIAYPEAEDIQIIPGGGVKGFCEGKSVHLGNARWFEQSGIPIVHSVEDAAQLAAEKGHMLAFVGWEGVCRTALVFGVKTHPDSNRVIQAIQEQPVDIIVLTGDGKKQTSKFCGELAVRNWMAELTPENKNITVKELVLKKGPVAMVGDGVNDAMALASADVGIAVGNATELARETADVVLQSHSISQLLPLLTIARTAQRAIVTNLFWAFGYNALAIILAVSGGLQPVIAAALMAGSSLVVVFNTLHHLGEADPEPATEPIRYLWP